MHRTFHSSFQILKVSIIYQWTVDSVVVSWSSCDRHYTISLTKPNDTKAFQIIPKFAQSTANTNAYASIAILTFLREKPITWSVPLDHIQQYSKIIGILWLTMLEYAGMTWRKAHARMKTSLQDWYSQLKKEVLNGLRNPFEDKSRGTFCQLVGITIL